ncbi:hypothetical protein EIP91_003765 [Steccherinum ochraceum]|uniref:Protein kinase domain-containing protein n=1 Tax=Steccherinum ochraceum TaxID=92696 RepID=A0A4R0R9Z5_9APHY|nr:hypothetical protein EIP91_003765 [Steccherinum ochraceum]
MDLGRRAQIDRYIYHAIPEDPDGKTDILSIPAEDAQDTIDVAWKKVDEPVPTIHPNTHTLEDQTALLRKLCLKISSRDHILPTDFYITGVKCTDPEPQFSGSSAHIYLGEYRGKVVIVKRPLISSNDMTGTSDLMLEFCREALLWNKLRHPHILPLIGVSRDAFVRTICLVSPRMDGGSLRQRVSNQDHGKRLSADSFEAHVNRWLYQAVLGLVYLHGQGVVHGDFHGGNILIDADETAKVTDFGFSLIADATPKAYGSRHGGAAFYWRAPEFWEPELFGLEHSRASPACDSYAFGCTCIEVYTDRAPWTPASGKSPTMYRVSKEVLNGKRPPRPTSPYGNLMCDHLWEVVEDSWRQYHTERLTAAQIADRMAVFG